MGLKDRFGALAKSKSSTSDGDDLAPTATGTTARRELRNFKKQHRWDPFLDDEKLETIESALQSDNAEKAMAVDETLIQEDSPYAEVRASVGTQPFSFYRA